MPIVLQEIVGSSGTFRESCYVPDVRHADGFSIRKEEPSTTEIPPNGSP